METLKATGGYVIPYQGLGKSQATAFTWSQELWDELVKSHNDLKVREKKMEADKERADQERKERLSREMEEVREACGGKIPIHKLEACWTITNPLPDGSRLYILNLPVKENLKERKQFQFLFIRCKEEKWACDDQNRVTGYMSYTTGDSSSFPSYSATYGSTDEEVLWECCRCAYHSW
jgi:hypothetical protein